MSSGALRTALLTSSLLFAVALPESAQQAEDTITPWHVAGIQSVRSAAVSPDGSNVAYVLSVPRTPWEEKDGSARSELHVLDWESGESFPYVTVESGVSSVRWTPDSRGIAFLAKREDDDHRALYVISVRGGEAQKALSLEDRGIDGYDFSPDGKRVAFLARVPVSKERKKEEDKGFKQEVYEEDWRPVEVWLGAPFEQDAEPERLELEGHVSALEWNPSGTSLAVSIAPTSLVDDSYTSKNVWVVDVEGGEVRVRIQNGGKLGPVTWSPDGKGLALIAGIDEHDGSAARLLFADLSLPSPIQPMPMLGERERDEHQALWLADGGLLVRGSSGARSILDLYRVEGGKALDRRSLLPVNGPAWSSLSVSADGQRAALVGSTPDHPAELFTLEAGGAAVRRTNSNEWLEGMRFAKQEIVRFPARDGVEVEGILIHPRDAQGPAPLIVGVHGGPEAHISNGWLTSYSYPGQIAAAQGYAVFYPNYRGSTGRGLAYLKLSQGDPAGKEFDDVVDGVDYLIAQGIADRDRVGVTGGSYGGYATAWFSTFYSDRFAAGVMFVGISNKISKVGTTDIPDEEHLVHAMKRPWEDWQFFLERSPIFYADRNKTPLLILHGKEDPRVDPGQSREMYRHVKLRGEGPVRLVEYPGEGHGNRRAGARFDYSLRMLRWFDHFLKGEGGEAPDYAIDYKEHMDLPDKDESEGS